MGRKGEPICLKIAAYLSQSAVANGDGPSTQLEILDIIAGDNNVPTENAITANTAWECSYVIFHFRLWA
jgi:hypothetical protein